MSHFSQFNAVDWNEEVLMEPNLGDRIRQERRKKRITLKQLSALSGLSVSFLSQIERGVTSITVTSLKKISDALQVPTSNLFEFDTPQPGFFRSREMQKSQQLVNTFTTHTRLSGNFDGRKLEAIIYHLEPGTKRTNTFGHDGEEFHYVLSGTASFMVGTKIYLLHQGDSLHFPSTLPHNILNTNPDQSVEILSVLTPSVFI